MADGKKAIEAIMAWSKSVRGGYVALIELSGPHNGAKYEIRRKTPPGEPPDVVAGFEIDYSAGVVKIGKTAYDPPMAVSTCDEFNEAVMAKIAELKKKGKR